MAAPVTICDVGPRDGLQNEAETLAPEVRAELVHRLSAAGLQSIEAVSFVRAESVPQMAGAEEVVADIERQAGVTTKLRSHHSASLQGSAAATTPQWADRNVTYCRITSGISASDPTRSPWW